MTSPQAQLLPILPPQTIITNYHHDANPHWSIAQKWQRPLGNQVDEICASRSDRWVWRYALADLMTHDTRYPCRLLAVISSYTAVLYIYGIRYYMDDVLE